MMAIPATEALAPGDELAPDVQRAFADGLTRATASLSEMVGLEIVAVEPRVRLAPVGEAAAAVGRPDEVVVGVYLAVTGPWNAHVVLLFSPKDACQLVDLLLGQPLGMTQELDEMAESALREVANITGTSFANVLGDRTHALLWTHPPELLIDMAGALVDGVVAQASAGGDRAVLIETRFARPTESATVGGTFLVMPEMDQLDALARALRGEA
jgi:chemotaxis protein CheC